MRSSKNTDPSLRISHFTGSSTHLLNKLNNHTDNIRKFLEQDDRGKVKKEKINADRIVNQLNDLIDEMKDFRQQIDNTKLKKFDVSTESHVKLISLAIKQYQDLLEELKYEPEPYPSLGEPSSFMSSSNYGDLQTLKIDDLVLYEDECQQAQSQLEAVENIQNDITDIHDIYGKLGNMVQSQAEVVDNVEANIEETAVNVSRGRQALAKAEKYKCVWYPVTGAVIGACIGGPIGLAVGLKVAGLTLLGGSAVGFTGGRILKKKKEATIIVEPIVSKLEVPTP